MYGVPPNLDLSLLQGAELTQLCFGQYDVQLHFHPFGHISVTGEWELFSDAGSSIDRNVEERLRPPFPLQRLLGQKVVGFTICAPDSLELAFGNGDRLQLIDNSAQYESFTIDLQPQGSLIIV